MDSLTGSYFFKILSILIFLVAIWLTILFVVNLEFYDFESINLLMPLFTWFFGFFMYYSGVKMYHESLKIDLLKKILEKEEQK